LIFNNKGLLFQYFEHEYPASARSYSFILSQGPAQSSLVDWAENFTSVSAEPEDWEAIKSDLLESLEKEPGLKNAIDAAIASINASEDLMLRLLELQLFQPVPW